MIKMTIFFLLLFVLNSCDTPDETDNSNNTNTVELYFPPIENSEWETVDFESLNWNENGLEELYNFLADQNTRAFIVLKNGRIAIEKYWGNNILDTSAFNAQTNWYWASTGKTLTASLVGIAEKNGILNTDDKTSDYLGTAWSSLNPEKENLITIKNQLSMTTGLDYQVDDLNCTLPSCLEYKADAGTQWYYHNAPYTLLEQVISNASGVDYNLYTEQKLKSFIGMNGSWIANGFNNVFWSTPRSMARFGLITLNKGRWEDSSTLYTEEYFNEMISTSQNINLSYGYLWWLNGKDSIQFPGLSVPLNTSLSPNAPDDLIAGLGKNGQFLDIVPSENLVIVRMGETPDGSLVPIQFHDEMWVKLNTIFNE